MIRADDTNRVSVFAHRKISIQSEAWRGDSQRLTALRGNEGC
jgi:hypothetical protein